MASSRIVLKFVDRNIYIHTYINVYIKMYILLLYLFVFALSWPFASGLFFVSVLFESEVAQLSKAVGNEAAA